MHNHTIVISVRNPFCQEFWQLFNNAVFIPHKRYCLEAQGDFNICKTFFAKKE